MASPLKKDPSPGGPTTDGSTIFTDQHNLIVDRLGGETALAASRALQTDSEGDIEVSAVTNTELGHVSGVTSAIQTQLDAKGDALTANPLSQFAATTSAQLAGVLSDETGTGSAVFASAPEFVGQVGVGIGTAALNGNDITLGGSKLGGKDSPLQRSRGIKIVSDVTLDDGEATNGIDYQPTITTDSATGDHVSGFQSRQIVDTNGSATLSAVSGYMTNMRINPGVTVTDVRGYRHFDADDGGGTITNQYGYWCETLDKATNNFAFYSEDGNFQRFGGTLDVVDTNASAIIRATRYTNSITAGPNFILRKGRGTETTPSDAQSGDRIGLISFAGYNGNGHDAGAWITAELAGTPTQDVSFPGRLLLMTTPSGGLTPLTRLQINSDGSFDFNSGAITNFTFDADATGNTITNIGSSEIKAEIVTGLTEETTPAAGDFLLGVESGGELRKFDVGDLPSGGGGDTVVGTQTKFISAAAMYPGGANPATGPVVKQFGANNQPIQAIEFPDGADYECYIQDVLDNWSSTTKTIKVKAYWFREDDEATPESKTIEFEVSGVSLGNFDGIGGTAYGTAVAITDTTDSTAAEDKMNITAASSDITIAGSPAEGDWVSLKIMRDDSAGTQTGSIFLAGISVEYTIQSGTSTI